MPDDGPHGAIAIIAALDTKGAEAAYLRDLIAARNHATFLIDTGIIGDPRIPLGPYDVSAAEVARAAGTTLQALRDRADRPSDDARVRPGVPAFMEFPHHRCGAAAHGSDGLTPVGTVAQGLQGGASGAGDLGCGHVVWPERDARVADDTGINKKGGMVVRSDQVAQVGGLGALGVQRRDDRNRPVRPVVRHRDASLPEGSCYSLGFLCRTRNCRRDDRNWLLTPSQAQKARGKLPGPATSFAAMPRRSPDIP